MALARDAYSMLRKQDADDGGTAPPTTPTAVDEV